jgi:hypothetical protein
MTTGTIAYCSREDHTPPMFSACLGRLLQRHPHAQLNPMICNDVASGRNQAVLNAEGDWLFFIDTDMLFASDTLDRLLAHQVDAVQAFVLKRHPPHEPLVYAADPNGGPVLKGIMPTGAPRLVEVPTLGAGGTLYRKRVFERIPGPWFEGVIGTEDTTFAQKMRIAGFRLWVDLATPCGHLTPMAIWPQRVRDTWHVKYEAMNGQSITIDPGQARLVRPPTPEELAQVR